MPPDPFDGVLEVVGEVETLRFHLSEDHRQTAEALANCLSIAAVEREKEEVLCAIPAGKGPQLD